MKKTGYHGNKNAAHDADELATSYIHARCKQIDKAAWVKAAQDDGLKLTEWIIKKLNNS